MPQFFTALKIQLRKIPYVKQQHIADASIRRTAHRHNIKIYTLSVMPDHVHTRVSLPHGMTDSKALMLLKGGSAYTFFKNHPKSRQRLPNGHLWSAGGCATTVGYNDLATVDNYILHQAEHHRIIARDTPSL